MDAIGLDKLTGAFILSADSMLQTADELPRQLRREIGLEDGEYALSRANSRTYSKIIDANAAMLIRQFKTSSTIAQAVARFSRAKNIDAQRLLDDALPLLLALIASRLLVPADGVSEVAIGPSLPPGTQIEGWYVTRCVQAIEDTELYQVRNEAGEFGALKIARPNLDSTHRAITREVELRATLGRHITPALLTTGHWRARPFLIMEWFCGSEATIVCAGLRQSGDRADRYELWRVTTAMLRAYAWLHEHGVIHGDVQPRNILIDRRGRVTLVDFGLARRHADKPIDAAVGRGGVSFFFDPEFAKTMLDGAAPGASTKAGEQYALAALLYFLVTGSHYLDFTVEKRAMLHQIIESPMISFSQRGVCDWPRAEHALQRALNKDPAERFPCVAEFCAAWQQAGAPKRIMAASSNGSAALVPIGREFIDSSSLSAALFRKQSMQAPSVSLTYGSAGLAYALSRIAVALNDAEHFAVADAWIEKALREIGDADAFHSELVGITAERVGASSLYHGRAGVHAVRALIAIERGDVATRNASLQMFLQTACQACDVVDVTLGNAGALLGCALLVESLNDSNAALLALGNDLVDRLFQSGPPEMLGIAHGLAGIVYAALAWSQVTEAPLQNAVISHLEKLASYAEPSGRGAQWKISMGSDDAEPRYHYGWCNGTAGFVFLWTLANRITRDARYAALAESAAWNVWERLSPNPSLCCGATGQAYALLNFYRYSGDAMWLRRAKRAAEAAARAWTEQSPQSTDSPDARPTSLYKGAAGIAVLSAELESPHHARMPMFELQ